jgi:hypothetical protein
VRTALIALAAIFILVSALRRIWRDEPGAVAS